MRQTDFIWPTEEQLRREVALSKRIARRDAERRKVRRRRELLADFGWVIVAVLLLALVVLLWWLASGQSFHLLLP